MTPADTCVRVAIVDPHELIAAGLDHVLSRCRTRPFQVVAPEDADAPPDIVLYNVERDEDGSHDVGLHRLLRQSHTTIIATYRNQPTGGVESALRCGAHGAVSLRLPAAELIEQVMSIHLRGRVEGGLGQHDHACLPEVLRAGLTPRELEVLGLIGAGMTNHEIARHLFISLNTVKTYIRGAYQKIAVERRAQAVIWVMRQGLTPPPTPPDPTTTGSPRVTSSVQRRPEPPRRGPVAEEETRSGRSTATRHRSAARLTGAAAC